MAWSNYRPKKPGASKYRAEKVVVDGELFDSKREARRWNELRLRERAGEIKNLKRQVKYVLLPAQREPDTKGKRGGNVKGRVIEREVSYYADFVYEDTFSGKLIVEDAKGMRTDAYILKRKMLLYFHGIRIREV